ncbi:MAG: short-chain fatty acid transporter [Acidimicrobiia bacterium]|nr:short-chain fatty acid transporter [Acidimicrobiia bacterium]
MDSSKLEKFARGMGRAVPDAITASIMLMLVLCGVAVALGNTASQTVEAYYKGLWMLLPFTMQMTLIIVLSAVLGATPMFRRAIVALSRLPSTRNQVVILAVAVSAAAAYLYWGLGIALSPIVAVYFAREAERKGLKIDFLFFLAVIWAANAVWQFGLSASAPLLVATPGHFLEKEIGIVSLKTTIWSPAALVHEVVFLAAVMIAGCWLMPSKCRPVSEFPGTSVLLEPGPAELAAPQSFSERAERNSFWTVVLSAALCAWLWFHFIAKGASLDINSLNTTLLLACLLLHGNVHSFTRALQKAASTGWAVMVVYHLYAGVAGLVQFTSTGERLAGLISHIATPLSFPVLTAAVSAVFAIFIPSSGGQWAVQGYVTSKVAESVGVSVQRGILSLSVGDHMGNLTSPFWYVVVAGITNVDFRGFFGYGLIFAAIWFLIGSVVFTFLPC